MSVADILINLVNWVFQKLVLTILPVDLPLISFDTFYATLHGSIKHNFIYAFSGLNNLFNLNLLFALLLSMIVAEMLFWLVRIGIFMAKLIRG